MESMPLAIAVFALTYVLMLLLPDHRKFVALGSAAIFVVTGMLPLGEIPASISWNVIMMIVGTMGLVSLFIDSRMPARMADAMLNIVPNVKWAVVALALFAGVISAFVDNVATVLMVAPVAMAICKKLDTNPVPVIISIAVSSNLQGAATLVGDSTAIMLGDYAKMSFNDFFFYQGKPSIFFAVELGAVAAAIILLFMFRKETGKIEKFQLTPVTDYVPTVLLAGAVLLLIVASFLPNMPEAINGIICMSLMGIGLIYTAITQKTAEAVFKPIKELDFDTILLLLGLFMVIGGIKEQGVIDALANLLSKLGGGNLFLSYTIILWFSVIISAFVDNIPYVMTMLPVVQAMAATMSAAMGVDPVLLATPLYFGLLSGATLGGNLTPFGASANITGIGILRKAGYQVQNKDFFRIGIPFTLAAIIPAYIYLWVVFGV